MTVSLLLRQKWALVAHGCCLLRFHFWYFAAAKEARKPDELYIFYRGFVPAFDDDGFLLWSFFCGFTLR